MDAVLKRTTVLVGVAFGISAQAQTPPNAGSLLQQIQQEKRNEPPAQVDRPPATKPPAEPVQSGITLKVLDFKFEGNTLLSDQVLHATVASWTGKTLDFGQLERVAQIVAERYRQAGWVVRAYLPQQDVTAGVVTIRVVEAHFGKAELEGAAPARLAPDVALKMVRGAQAPGAPLNADKVERAVLLVGELPGISPSASLKAGASDGETDVLLNVREGQLVTGEVGIDNAGARSTGTTRWTGNAALNDPFGIGDQFQLGVIHSQGSDYGRVGYSLPVGSDGLRLGTYFSALSYSLVGSDFSALEARGRSNNYGLNLRYPWILSRLSKVYASLSYDRKRFDNQANQATTSHYGINDIGLGLTASHYDQWLGGGMTSGSATYTRGNNNLNGSPNQLADSVTTQAAGSFQKLQYSFGRYQTLNDKLSLNFNLAGQMADKNLDSAEKFYLGGIGGVRAYPANEAGGTSGRLLNLELRRRLNANLLATAFYDWGHISSNKDNDFPGAPVMNSYSLRGAGLGLIWTSDKGLSVTAEWARRIGQNPNQTATGKDQDGSLDKNRIWLVVGMPFGFDLPTRAASAPRVATAPHEVVEPKPAAPAAVPAPAQSPAPAAPVAPNAPAAVPAAPAAPAPEVAGVTPVVVPVLTEHAATPALEPVAEAPVAAVPKPDPVPAIEKMIEQWRQAWESRDLQAYLAFYAQDFQPAAGMTRSQWLAQRKQRLSGAASIQLTLFDFKYHISPDTVTVHFVQRYKANNYADLVSKTIEVKRENDKWVIVSERQQEVIP